MAPVLYEPKQLETPRGAFPMVCTPREEFPVDCFADPYTPRELGEALEAQVDHSMLSHIMNEYNQMIADLAKLTANLPRRLCSDASIHTKRYGSEGSVASETKLKEFHLLEKLEGDPKLAAIDSETSSPDASDRSLSPTASGLKFSLREGWQANASDESDESLDLLVTTQQSEHMIKALESNAGGVTFTVSNASNSDLFQQMGRLSYYLVSRPTNAWRMFWELCGLALVLYDVIAVPLTLTFRPSGGEFFEWIDWIALLYWTFNIPVVLTTGFFSNGVVVMKLDKIFWNYLKTWFIVDLLTLIPEWFFMILDKINDTNEIDGGSTMKVLRASRFFRLARLFRMVKLRNAWNAFCDRIDSEKLGILVEIWMLILLLMLVNHFNACVWFAIGDSEDTQSWVKHYVYTLEHVDWTYQYMVAYHWSITLFTPASMSLQPQSLKERMYAISAVILGLVGFSSIIGRITSSMNQLHTVREVKHKSFTRLRKYLWSRHVEQELSMRIRTYLDYRWEQQNTSAAESKVELLGLLSESLRAELASAIHSPPLAIHPLFLQLQSDSSVTTRRIILKGVSVYSLATHDWMFRAGEEASYMSMVIDGRLEYFRNFVQGAQIVEANQDWIAEQTLWVKRWRHVGDMRSLSSTDLLRIAPEKLFEVVNLNPVAFQLVSTYARNYVRWLNETSRRMLSDVHSGAQLADELRAMMELPEREPVARNSILINVWRKKWNAPTMRGALRTSNSSMQAQDSLMCESFRNSVGSKVSDD